MAFLIKDTLQVIQSYLIASGYTTASVGEPKSPPSEIHAAIFMTSTSVVRLMLNGATEELHVATVRLHENMLGEPQEDIEFLMAERASKIMEDLFADFELGGNVRNIDAAGINGAPVRADWGYNDVGGKMYRIIDITIPMVVDGSATMAA